MEDVIETYYDNLAIEPIPNTQLVDIAFESEDPELAASVANNHARAYIQNVLGVRAGVTDSAADWMLERLAELRNKLEESEQQLQEFREREQLIDVEGLRSLPTREINELTSRLVEVRSELSQDRIAYSQVFQGRTTPVENLRGIAAILDDPVVQELQAAEAQAQRKVAELAKRYGPLHPEMIAAQSELTKATESLDSQRRNVSQAIRKKYEATRAAEIALVNELDRAKQLYQEVGRKESQLLALQREAETNRTLYDLFYNRLSETTATGGLESPPARIVSSAVAPIKPSKPKKRLVVAAVFVLALAIGAMVAFLAEIMNNSVRSAADVEETLGMPLLAMVPLLKRKSPSQHTVGTAFFDESEHGFHEAIRTVRTAISLDNLDQPHKLIMVASSIGGEGKSSIAMNLAHAFAQSEKVLLVDADLRRPSIGRELTIMDDRPGLTELLGNKADISECLHLRQTGSADVLLSGSLPKDPLQLLSTDRLAVSLAALQMRYDRIVIDTPPVLPVSDALVISQLADAIVYVVKCDATPIRQVKQGLGLLTRFKPVTGLVINQLDTSKAAKYSEYGYGGYYETYESGSVAT